ncbi:MAG: DUF1579 domain-containing protein [Bacteroidetes bacterium]|nr:MAG: DUF1579 domain-containing protein [Bacteroidota bacterium]
MKVKLLFLLISCIPLLAVLPAISQDKEMKMPSQEEMMKKWQEAMTPGEQHKKLEGMAGMWDLETKFWMDGPDKPPTVTKGSAEMTMEMDGRFLCQKMKGEMMGMPMTGMGYTGYDNMKKMYWMFWIDNTSTAMFTGEGNFDKEGKTLTMTGKMDDPVTGEMGKTIKYICKMNDKDSWTFEMQDMSMPGDNKTTGVITYTRKK